MTSQSNSPKGDHPPFSAFSPAAGTPTASSATPAFAGKFLPRLVHELRSPSHAISYFLDTFDESLDGVRLPGEAQENLEMIRTSASELRALLSSLSRLAHSQDEKQAKPLKIRTCVERAWIAVENEHEIKAELKANCSDISFTGDDRAIDVCLQCILDNSFKFKHAERPLVVSIEAEEDDKTITLTIVDNGIGIETKYLEKCYQYFERLHSRSSYQGGGLGIPTAAECIHHMNGQLKLESDGESFTKVTLTFAK